MTYQEALQYIHAVSWTGSRPGLERITRLLALLGHPERQLRYVHIVGTNGKGSTAAMTASALTAAGVRTGMFTSPYLLDFRERMQIDGEMIPPGELAELTGFVRPFAQSMADPPTEFELITAIALCWFARRECGIVVLEAGMGGELDATNAIPAPEIAVFTNIGLDHTEYLGSTVAAIAETKAGILKPGCRAVAYPTEPQALAVIAGRCANMEIPLTVADPELLTPVSHSLEGQRFLWRGAPLELPLLGAHQRVNAAVAITVLTQLADLGWPVEEAHIRAGLARVRWPGRFEVLGRSPLFLLDGGHNPQCMQALEQAVADYLGNRRLLVITGVLADKDYHAMYDRMGPQAACFFTLTPPNPRALSAGELAQWLSRYGKPVTVCPDPARAVAQALAQAGPEDAIVCYGSLYLAADLRRAYLEAAGSPAPRQ